VIARIWHGRTRPEDYDAYTRFLEERAVPDYRSTPGFVRLSFLRRLTEEAGEFTLITWWESLEAIRAFAGDEIDRAKYYPEDSEFLLEFEERVSHWEPFVEG